MRKDASILLLSSATLFVVSCGGDSGITSAGSSNPGYGPFDRHGNELRGFRLVGYFKPEDFAQHLKKVLDLP